jgi:homoserine O-succinyltransferase
MPIVIHKDMPAFDALSAENIFVMDEARAYNQDIRPIEIAIVNLMPDKIITETQLLRVLSNTPLQVNITLLQTATHKSKNTSESHLNKFYLTFEDVRERKFDGMIITGAPVETLPFKDVNYWDELKSIMRYAVKNVTSTVYICWGAQAALKYHFNIEKCLLPEKLFGVFKHRRAAGAEYEPLLKGCDDEFFIPHSRHTGFKEADILKEDGLRVLAYSAEAGSAIIKSKDNKMFFMTGHLEYDRETLKNEYQRDIGLGLKIKEPKNYFADGKKSVKQTWSGAANLIFTNWLNYYVYQITPFDWTKKV